MHSEAIHAGWIVGEQLVLELCMCYVQVERREEEKSLFPAPIEGVDPIWECSGQRRRLEKGGIDMLINVLRTGTVFVLNYTEFQEFRSSWILKISC